MDQYEMCFYDASCISNGTGSHRLAWGANYGAVGGADMTGMYNAYGDDKQLSGWPYQSYSVFTVLGKHTEAKVMQQVREIETVQKTSLTASVGTVVGMLPGGIARTDMVATQPPGYDGRYSTWNILAASNKATFTYSISEGALADPILVISGFTGATAPSITVDGAATTPDVDVLVSLVPDRQELWITFRPGWSGTHEIAIQ